MSDKQNDGFENIFSLGLSETCPSIEIDFPVPNFLKTIVDSEKYRKRALEYYLLARFSFFHRMNSSYMTNSHWAVEFFMLSMTTFDCSDYNNLLHKASAKPHQITKYWNYIKTIYPDSKEEMEMFDVYIGKVYGIFDAERYVKETKGAEVTSQGSSAAQVFDKEEKKIKSFKKNHRLDLSELDCFVSFVLTKFSANDDVRGNFGEWLASKDCRSLYEKNNRYSVLKKVQN